MREPAAPSVPAARQSPDERLMGASHRVLFDLSRELPSCRETAGFSGIMIRSLACAHPELQITVLVPLGSRRPIVLPNVGYCSLPDSSDADEASRQLVLTSYLTAADVGCLIAPASILPLRQVCPTVSVIHDLGFEVSPGDCHRGQEEFLRQWVPPSLSLADHVATTSPSVIQELHGRMGIPRERTSLLNLRDPESVCDRLSEAEAAAELAALRVTCPFLLHISNLCQHKNVDFVLRAFSESVRKESGPAATLVIVGLDPIPGAKERVIARARSFGIIQRLRYIGSPSARSLWVLLRRCCKVLLPWTVEGWASGVLEARRAGATVVASPSVLSAREEERLPLQPHLWAKAMSSEGGRRERVDDGTGPASTGKQLWDVLSKACLQFHSRKPAGTSSGKHACGGPDARRLPSVALRGDWRSPSGFGEATRSVGAALAEVGLHALSVGAPKDIVQRKDLWPGDIALGAPGAGLWIHCGPPEFIDETLEGRHAALFFWETDRLPDTEAARAWRRKLSRMDEVWAPSTFVKETLEASGIALPIVRVPLPVDTQLFAPGPRAPIGLNLPDGFDESWTVFLYVGTWDPRKQPDVLVRAFTTTFSAADKALLLIKSYATGNASRDQETLGRRVEAAKAGTAHVRIIAEVLPREGMANLFRFSSAFVTASHGEGFCIPAVQAMSCSVPVIAPAWSSLRELAGIPVDFRLEKVPDSVALPGFGRGQHWAAVVMEDLSKKLRWTHENPAPVRELGREARCWVELNATPAAVGNLLKERIRGLLSRAAADGVRERLSP